MSHVRRHRNSHRVTVVCAAAAILVAAAAIGSNARPARAAIGPMTALAFGTPPNLDWKGVANAVNTSGLIVGFDITADQAFASVGPGNLTDLGTLSGGHFSEALGVNDSGLIVGDSTDADGVDHAMFTTVGGTMTDLTLNGGLVGIDSSSTSSAAGVNNSGMIVGTARSASGASTAFYYDTGGALHPTMVTLGTLGGVSATATGINNHNVVVGYGYDSKNDVTHAFYEDLDAATPTMTLVPMPTDVTDSRAFGINDSGDIVGYADSSDGSRHVFLYSPATGTTTLLALPSSDTAMVANGINNEGVIVGYAIGGDGSQKPFVVDPSGVNAPSIPTDLGTLGGPFAWANGISNSGLIVGFSIIQPGGGAESDQYAFSLQLTTPPPPTTSTTTSTLPPTTTSTWPSTTTTTLPPTTTVSSPEVKPALAVRGRPTYTG